MPILQGAFINESFVNRIIGNKLFIEIDRRKKNFEKLEYFVELDLEGAQCATKITGRNKFDTWHHDCGPDS